jgi:hypothetical protein
MQIESLATAEDGRQNFLRLGRSENKFHVLWGLFQRLQKRVERGGRKHVHLVDEINFVTPFGRRIPNILAQLAYILDAVVAGAIDFDHVETVAAGNLATVIAQAAWRNRRAFDAVERLRQNSCRRSFANTARTDKKIRVRETVLCHRIFQRARDVSLADQIVKRLRSILSGENLVAHAVNLNGNAYPRKLLAMQTERFGASVRLAQRRYEQKRGPASFPGGALVKLPELSGHCHATSAGTAGAATAAAFVTGRDRGCACQRHNCCNQKQIFHDSLLMRFRKSSAA